MRSKMCESGRKERHSCWPGSSWIGMRRSPEITFDVMLPWVSITPFGFPVVPDV